MNKIQRDPVCGMTVYSNSHNFILEYEDKKVFFCSELCKELFLRNPHRYKGRLVSETKEDLLHNVKVAYFSMEVAINSKIPTYSGGLGILAGDSLKSFASLCVPAIGITLLYRKGYFDQTFDESGLQKESPVDWEPNKFLKNLDKKIYVNIEGRDVTIQGWKYNVVGSTGYIIPLIFLDTDLEENSEYDRSLTDYLYGGDQRYRFAQEIVLGIGGILMLEKLGYKHIDKFHMNEGHAALLVLELLKQSKKGYRWRMEI